MSVDLGDLLRDAGGEPSTTPDPDEIWRRGRHRRRLRTLAASAGGVAVIAALVVLPLSSDGGLQPVIEPLGQDEATSPSDDAGTADSADDVAEAEPAEGHDPTDLQGLRDNEVSRMEQLLREAEERRVAAEKEAAKEAAAEAEAEAEAQAQAQAQAETGPEPDPARFEDPCAVHEGGEMRAFIDVVSPVEGQRVGNQVELVGCSSTFEGTLVYRVLDASEQTLLQDITMGGGGPAIGEFQVTIDLPAAGDLYVEVYWEDQASGSEAHPDGPERDLVRIPIVAG